MNFVIALQDHRQLNLISAAYIRRHIEINNKIIWLAYFSNNKVNFSFNTNIAFLLNDLDIKNIFSTAKTIKLMIHPSTSIMKQPLRSRKDKT